MTESSTWESDFIASQARPPKYWARRQHWSIVAGALMFTAFNCLRFIFPENPEIKGAGTMGALLAVLLAWFEYRHFGMLRGAAQYRLRLKD